MTLLDYPNWIKDNRQACINVIMGKLRVSLETAEDIFQTQAITAFNYLKTNEVKHFKSWFMGGCINASRNYIKVNKRYDLTEKVIDGSGELTPEQICSNNETIKVVHSWISTLTAGQQNAIKQYYFEDNTGNYSHPRYETFKTHRRLALQAMKRFKPVPTNIYESYPQLTAEFNYA